MAKKRWPRILIVVCAALLAALQSKVYAGNDLYIRAQEITKKLWWVNKAEQIFLEGKYQRVDLILQAPNDEYIILTFFGIGDKIRKDDVIKFTLIKNPVPRADTLTVSDYLLPTRNKKQAWYAAKAQHEGMKLNDWLKRKFKQWELRRELQKDLEPDRKY